MALDKDRWGDAVAAAVAGISVPQDSFITPAQLQQVWRAVCGEHKTEINDNAEVMTTVAVTSVSGVTPGGGVSGPGTGTGTGQVA